MRYVMIGAGAIGGITAAYIKKAGYDITLVCKHKEIADIANGKGLHIMGVKGDEYIKVPAVVSIDELTGQFDVCMIATKAYDMPDCARQMLPMLKKDSLVLSMQNGICTDALAEIVGNERTVGTVIGFGGTMHGPGELEMTSTGEFIIGRIQGGRTLLEPVREVLASVTEALISDRMFEELYSKLIVNSCITSLGAVCGLKLGQMLKIKQARKIFLAVIGEAVNVAKAMKLEVPPYGGKLDYFKLMQGTTLFDSFRRHLMIYIVGVKYKNLKSSSLQSLERGRPTEIDYFNGYIMKKGKEYNVPCPVNARLVQMVKEIEQKKREIKKENLWDEQFKNL